MIVDEQVDLVGFQGRNPYMNDICY